MAKKGLKIVSMSLLFLIIVAAVFVTLFFTVFKPKDPNIIVEPVGLKHFEVTTFLANLNSNVSLAMVITMGNPNYGSFEFPKGTGYVSFDDKIVGEVPLKGGLVPQRDHITVNTFANLMTEKLMADTKFLTDVSTGLLNFTSATALTGKVHMLNIFKMKATVYCNCDISFNITSKNAYSKCISKLKF